MHMSGELRYTIGRGLTLNGVSLRLSHEIGLYPAPKGQLPSPSSLSGREVSVIGRRSPFGMDVVLMIDHSRQPSGSSPKNTPTPGYIPSESDSNVGEISDDVGR